jgi:mannose/fructose/sorbose-specific phosphotransferase system IIA component
MIATHGALAGTLLATAEMITGPVAHARAVDFEVGTSVEDLENRMEAAIQELGGESAVLVLVDLAGGSPSRAAAKMALAGKAEVLTGVNLPMVIAAVSDDTADAETIAEAGRTGIGSYGVAPATGGGLR